MKSIQKISLLALVTLFFAMSSCASDPTASNPDIQKLSPETRELLDKTAQSQCKCLKEHSKELKEALAEAKPIVKKVQAGEVEPQELMEAFRKLGPNMKNYRACGKDGFKPTEEQEEAMFNDLKKLFANEEEERSKGNEKVMEITVAFLKKNCPSESSILDDMNELGKAMGRK